MRRSLATWLAAAALAGAAPASADCGAEGLAVQVLGSTGPEILPERAATGYLLWLDGEPRVLVDAGPGSARNLARAGARFAAVDVLLLTHLHVDHVSDLPAYVKASYFGPRQRDLPVLGPAGNARMPGTARFLEQLFAAGGAWPYLADYLPGGPEGTWRLLARELDHTDHEPRDVIAQRALRLRAAGVRHGPIPALAWRVDAGGGAVAFSGDFNGTTGALEQLAAAADVLVAHNAVPEGAGRIARQLHAEPGRIGAIAAAAGVGRLVLSHRMRRTLGREDETLAAIRRHYDGPVSFAEDLDCYDTGRR